MSVQPEFSSSGPEGVVVSLDDQNPLDSMNEIPAALSRKVIIRLSATFWLAQMADAAALVLLGGHMSALGFSGMQISSVYATMGVAALV